MPVIFSRGDKLENGHYTVVKELGVGGMGVVYHCRDEQLMRDVAIKMLLPELMTDKSSVEIFRQEARLAAQLEHPNIVTVYEIGVEERQKKLHHYVSMEYLPGGNLANRVISGPLAVEHCLNWMKQLASGLTFAHKKGVVHQDIKADNIFITTEGDLKIGDFGLARLLVGRVHYNAATKGMGTPAYMSPELCRGEPQDHRSDIYSLGVLFFEMATGQLPFRARGMIEMATKHSSAPIPSAKRINPLIPEILDKVIKRMMSKTPEERYSNMSEVLTILDDLIFELRVARLGLGNRPLLRSGPVQMDPILQQQLAQQKAEEMSKPNTATPKQPPVSARDLFPRSAKSQSEELIAQLESVAEQAKIEADHDQVVTPVLEPHHRKPTDFVLSQRISKQPPAGDVQHSAAAAAEPASAKVEAKAPIAEATPLPATEPAQKAVAPLVVANQTSIRTSQNKMRITGARTPLEQLWSFKTHGPIGWSSSPVLDKDERVLYCASADSCLYALDVVTGKELWKYETGAPILASPILYGDKVAVVNAAGSICALSVKSGARVWNFTGEDELLATPGFHKEHLLVPTARGRLLSIDINSGVLHWQFKAGGAIVCAPQRHADLVLFGTKEGFFYGVSLDHGKKLWDFPAGGSIVASPAASVDSVYFGTQEGAFYALEAENGGLIWEYPTNKPIVSRAVIAFTSVIFASQDKWLYCCEKYDGSLKWKGALHGKTVANLVVDKELVLAATHEGWLQAFSTRNGELKWEKDCERSIESAPLVVNDKIYLGTVEGDIVAYSFQSDA